MAQAAANPAQFTIGVGVLGSTQHLTAELFKATSRLPLTIVPFNSAGNLLAAVTRGDVAFTVELITPVLSAVRAGTLKPLAISAARRFEGLPNVPTFMESGFVDYPMHSWGMIGAPLKTPNAIVERLSRESITGLAHPDVQKKANETGITIVGSTPREARELITTETARWKKIILDAKIEPQ